MENESIAVRELLGIAKAIGFYAGCLVFAGFILAAVLIG